MYIVCNAKIRLNEMSHEGWLNKRFNVNVFERSQIPNYRPHVKLSCNNFPEFPCHTIVML